ncbi:uncharacterized protein LOC130828682 [Amaranthus tricolor]|uniref:uncharacterized protein LOC130828682 n=1 Tax=Amaranthus tricolor TaxID=29722 RepID=UPI00258A0935|nr:uncharacterized protein LOC130828682 [Amaranthus tricolor]
MAQLFRGSQSSNMKSENILSKDLNKNLYRSLISTWIIIPKISAAQAESLETIPTVEDVKQAVWACGVDKAPGFDGYNFKFIREMWDTIKDDIYEFVLDFFVTGSSVRHVNVTWVTLIPKSENPTSIEEYRPISMILDGVLIANESVRWLKKKKTPGFGRKWVRWIMNCITTASMSILLNGSPLKPFKMERELRQGDPLSPYLFILVSEALVCILKKAEDMNLVEAVHIEKDKVGLKHLQFADDMLIFAPRNTLCITNYFRILDVFAIMSGLSLNYSKSTFISWNQGNQEWAKHIASQVGCRHATCPFTYLGFPIGDHMNRFSAWKPVMEKIQSRLTTWKSKILSRAGRLTLIKSVLNTLPVYYMRGVALGSNGRTFKFRKRWAVSGSTHPELDPSSRMVVRSRGAEKDLPKVVLDILTKELLHQPDGELKRPTSDSEDGVIWRYNGNLCYPVKSIAASMYEQSTPTLSKAISNIVWQRFIPPRAQLYVWLANLEKLNTGDFLVEKGIIDAQWALCPFCSRQTETNSHVLFSCDFSWSAWMNMLE